MHEERQQVGTGETLPGGRTEGRDRRDLPVDANAEVLGLILERLDRLEKLLVNAALEESYTSAVRPRPTVSGCSSALASCDRSTQQRMPDSSESEPNQVLPQDACAPLGVGRTDAVLERLLRPLIEKLERRVQMPSQEWFSILETAALTGLSADHVRRHVTAGLLPAANQGTFEKPCYRVSRKDIDAWMERRKETPQPVSRKGKKAGAGPGSFVSRHHAPRAS